MITVADWLDRREPPPPERLLSRIHESLGDGVEAPAHEAAARTVAAAERLLARLLSEECATRATAVDLLTADALVTYAFEAAAEHQGGSMDDMAASAMQRIAALRAGTS
jgi:hypothetical protein